MYVQTMGKSREMSKRTCEKEEKPRDCAFPGRKKEEIFSASNINWELIIGFINIEVTDKKDQFLSGKW